MFDWSGIPAQTIEQVTNPQPDTGISIKTSQGFLKKVTTSSWVTSFALSQDFRKGFLALIADMTPAEVFTKNNNQAIQATLNINGNNVITQTNPRPNILTGVLEGGLTTVVYSGSQTSPYCCRNANHASTCPGSYSPGFPHCKNKLKADSCFSSKSRIA